MSRDLTPKELDQLIKTTNPPNLTETLTISYNGTTQSAYSDDQKAIGRKYPRLGRFGFDFLMECKRLGIFSNQIGYDLVQHVENYFNGINIDDKELEEKIQLWYDGQLESGYYMEPNNEALAHYLKLRLTKD